PDGTFTFDNVAAGLYQIRVTLQGFRQSRVTLNVGGTAPAALRLKLEVGSTTESVTVSKAVPEALPPPAARPAPPPPPQAIAGVGGARGGMGYAMSDQIGVAPPGTADYAAIDE